MRESGSSNATVHAHLNTSISLQTSQDGQPTVQVLHCDCDVTRLGIRFHGDWFYQQIDGHIEKHLKGDVQRQICREVRTIVNRKANAELAELPLTLTFEDKVKLSYALASNPQMHSNFIEFLFKP